ncbi:glycosyltransferase 87 family protein [Leifsonia kafniensis]
MTRRSLLWTGFALVHGWLIWLCLSAVGWPLGDVEGVYRPWAELSVSGDAIVGIDTPFVYPIIALVPMVLALAFGSAAYALVWLGLVTVLDAVAFAVLLGMGRAPTRRLAGTAWWWLAFLLLLGPIALARIDSITVPLVIIALLWLRTRPFWGVVLLTVATWVKVWPAAALAALVVVSPRRWRITLIAGVTSAVIVVIALILGSGLNVVSFVGQQTGRGIQIESPVGTIWMWLAALGVPGSTVYYDFDILTFQVVGPGTDLAALLMTPLLVLAVGVVLLLGVRAQRRGAAIETLLPPLVLALVLTMITINKVGSPQFISWIAAPLILGIAVGGARWSTPAILGLVLAALTQLIYPYFYDGLLVPTVAMVLVLTLRNVLEFVLLGWALWALATAHIRRDGSGGTQLPGAHFSPELVKE